MFMIVKMKIAFLSNKLTLRGTEVNLYSYANYSEKILGHESIIITRPISNCGWEKDTHELAYKKFNDRFKVFYYNNIQDIDNIIVNEKVDLLFIEKAGSSRDGINTNKCKTLMHCVFDSSDKHGDYFTVISEEVNKCCKTNYPVLPNIVEVFDTKENLRKELNIPEEAIVYGIFGGKECFPIDYIRRAVKNLSVDESNNIYFVSLNIELDFRNDKYIYIPGTADMEYKRKFMNTCDAFLYGRDNGETFGLCCAEFSICDKPIIARNKPDDNFKNRFETFHIDTLKDNLIVHNDYEELIKILTNWKDYNKDVSNNNYKKYTPEYVMKIFNELIS